MKNLELIFDKNSIFEDQIENRILVDNYNILKYDMYTDEEVVIGWKIFNSVKEYIEAGYGSLDDGILEIHAVIKDYSYLSELTDLKAISLLNTYLEDIDFGMLPTLERVTIARCIINGKLDFSNNSNLEYISLLLLGDKSNTKLDIRGLEELSSFDVCSIEDDISDMTTFKNIILMDDYNLLYKTGTSVQLPDGDYSSVDLFCFERYENYNEFSEKYAKFIDFANLPANEVTEINFWPTGMIIKDLSSLVNLKKLYVHQTNAGYMDFSELTNLEQLNIYECSLNGTLNFSNNKKLNRLFVDLHGDLSNAVIDIRGIDWLEQFEFSHYNSSNFNLTNSILMEDYDDLSNWTNVDPDKGNIEYYMFYREIYNTIDEYLEAYYPGFGKEDITYLSIRDNVIIKDYSGLSTLPTLLSLEFINNDLNSINFEVAPRLENIYVYNCTLDGKLDFTKNSNLRRIDINLSGNLTNSVVDIRGLTNLERFNYEYYTDEASNFDLDRCILRDNTFELTHNSDTESMYESYYYNNYIEDPDYPEYPEYIVSNLNTSQIDEDTNIIYGFVLNNEGNLKVVDILSRNYFAEGITAKIFEDGTEVTNTDKIVGTGTVIKLYEGEELVEEYTMVIFGDTTGDGLINAVDALAIIKNKNQNVLFENKIFEEAGKVTEKTYYEGKIPSAVDALAIIKYINGRYDIDQRDYYYGIGGPVG